MIPGRFDVILPRKTKVTEQEVFRQEYSYSGKSKEDLNLISEDILFYVGDILDPDPEWVDEDEGNFRVLCTIEADTTALSSTLRQQKSRDGKIYYTFGFSVVISFGLTELVAQVAWEEKGQEKRGPARIVYDAA